MKEIVGQFIRSFQQGMPDALCDIMEIKVDGEQVIVRIASEDHVFVGDGLFGIIQAFNFLETIRYINLLRG